MIFATIAASSRTTFQPWYLIGILASAVFISDNFIIFFPSIIISFFALLTYVPYLFTGNWDPPIPQILTTMYLSSYIASAGGIFAYIIVQTRKAKFSFKNLRKSLHL
jgi:hypothetical protein